MTAQVEFTEHELLESHPYEAPLVAGGVTCHGGFDADGTYVSPRTFTRAPAIEAWQAQHQAQFATPLFHLPLDTWPAHYPNVAQAKHLIASGVPEPIVATLTRIGTVEGFGGMIRLSVVPDLQQRFDEDVTGTAMAHLDRGLYEAHARDEAGHGDEGGHKQMWFVARDLAFEDPVTQDETALMLDRMGITPPGSRGKIDLAAMRAQAEANRLWPDDVDFDLEMLVERMTRLLLIEISAFHTFAWAEEVLDDRDLVAGDGAAARMVSFIRQDETPHVEYLRTVLSEMRDRTIVGATGNRHAGTDLVGRTWDRAVAESLAARRIETLNIVHREVEHALAGRPDAGDVLQRFDELGDVVRADDGQWVDAAGHAA
jgi:hypothetical protein